MSLSDITPLSGFAVTDLTAAGTFYGETLGLTLSAETTGPLVRISVGGRDILMYEQPTATPASYTFLNFPVEDVDATVAALTARGVVFQRYEGMPQDEHGVMHGRGPTIAWFTDPSGNILSVVARD